MKNTLHDAEKLKRQKLKEKNKILGDTSRVITRLHLPDGHASHTQNHSTRSGLA